MIYKYFVSYFYNLPKGNWGVGNTVINRTKIVNSEQDIRDMQHSIEAFKQFQPGTVAINNYKKMGEGQDE